MSDAFTLYETGLAYFLERLGQDHPRYTEALTLEAQLRENVGVARLDGDTEIRRADRSRILRELNRLALETVRISFNTLCGLPDFETGGASLPLMVLIPAGEFLMGSDPAKDRQADDNELPQHTLYLPDYYIAKTPVTNAQYAVFVQATGCRPPLPWAKAKLLEEASIQVEGRELLIQWRHGMPPRGQEDHPMDEISWYDAVTYCKWLSQVTGRLYRLPSEAEWEKAARGSDGRIYPWGNEPPDEERCNFRNNVGRTTPVGRYSPQGNSPYGCADMAGNVWEWCATKWEGGYRDYKGDNSLEGGDSRVLRGGAFDVEDRGVRCAARGRDFPDFRGRGGGFRVVAARAPGQTGKM
jgi:formylglycine-generating enzyme required for sulfatase activity